MKVEVVTPEEFMGDVIGDLNSRRGQGFYRTKRKRYCNKRCCAISKHVWLYK